MESQTLINDLIRLTQNNKAIIETYSTLSEKQLNWKPNNESWSILECIEHLNRYGSFYIPEIENRIKQAKGKASSVFNSNWLGRYFSKSVAYSSELKKMKTFKSMNPIHSTLNASVLQTFITQQDDLINLLNQAKSVNLDKTKTSITISKLIKLKLGDTFRVVIYHNQRHIEQAKRNLELYK
ncbi:MAG: DinB family protein [Flavobacteriales bacterium]